MSPIWKSNEMLWLTWAWKVQYQGDILEPKEKMLRRVQDKEVVEFLNKRGANKDAKTIGTKGDNNSGGSRKIYEWERGESESI